MGAYVEAIDKLILESDRALVRDHQKFLIKDGRGELAMGKYKQEEVIVTDAITGGMKGQKDCQIGAVDPKAIWEVGRVAGFGAGKYERYNFAKGYKWSLSYDAMQRHLMAFWMGEDTDPESGISHLAHAAWHCLTLLTFSLRKKGTDDRFPA